MRNRYLDLLRAVAIVRVVVYHLFGWPWLSIVLPAMGIMFALAGSLTAASLDRRGAGSVVGSRLRRLLPPLWLLGLIAVPVMLALGWAHESDGTHPFSPAGLVLWVVPIADPPGSDKGVDIWDPLWYVRAYLWFVLLSPVLYAVYKKVGWVVVAAPIVAIAVLDKTGFSLPDAADTAMWDFVTFGACWIVGFAHHDGRLARTRPAAVLGAAVVLGGAALYWLRGHAGEDGYDLNDVAESQALWSLAFVLLVLRWQPPMGWLGRVRPMDRTVSLLNARAVTVYLWHNIAIDAVWPVLTVLALDDVGHLTDPVELATALAITGGAVLAFGWVEDLAARRRPRLLPLTADPRPAPGAARPGGGIVSAGFNAEPGRAAGRPAPVDGLGGSALITEAGAAAGRRAPVAGHGGAELVTEVGPGIAGRVAAGGLDGRDRSEAGRHSGFEIGGPGNRVAAEGLPVPRSPATSGPALHGHDGGPISWNAATMPQQRTDFGTPPAADPSELDLRTGSGSAAHDPRRPTHRGDDGGPPTGRSPVPWFGGGN